MAQWRMRTALEGASARLSSVGTLSNQGAILAWSKVDQARPTAAAAGPALEAAFANADKAALFSTRKTTCHVVGRGDPCLSEIVARNTAHISSTYIREEPFGSDCSNDMGTWQETVSRKPDGQKHTSRPVAYSSVKTTSEGERVAGRSNDLLLGVSRNRANHLSERRTGPAILGNFGDSCLKMGAR